MEFYDEGDFYKKKVAHWMFDETSGPIAPDYSEFGNHGNLVNMDDSNWRNGKKGNCLEFNGTDQYVKVHHSNSIDFGDEDFSVSFWLRQTLDNKAQRYIIKGTHTLPGSGKRYEIFHHQNGEVRFAIDDNIIKSRVIVSNTHFVTGDWIHVVAIRNTSQNKLLLYANTILKGGANDETGDISQTEDLYIGVSPDEANTNLKGCLDDIHIYNYALKEEEINEIYNLNPTAIEQKNNNRSPIEFKIMSYPNPFNSVVKLYYSLPEAGHVTIQILNIRGRMVKEILNQFKGKGHHQTVWNGTDDHYRKVTSGLFFYEMKFNGKRLIKKMQLLK